MFVLLVLILLDLCYRSQQFPAHGSRCQISKCRVSGPSLDSALETFLCLPEEEIRSLSERDKKHLLAEIITPYLHIQDEELSEMDSDRLVGLVNLVLHDVDNLEAQKRTEEEDTSLLISELVKNNHLNELNEDAYSISNPIFWGMINCETKQEQRKGRSLMFNAANMLIREALGIEDLTGSTGLPYPKNGNTDEKLSSNVKLKYFNKLNRDLGTTWEEGGQDIIFTGSELTIQDRRTFILDIKTVFTAHGFISNATTFCDDFVKSYLKAGIDVQVICIDWRNLANLRESAGVLPMLLQFGGMYIGEAHNSIDIGWWLGRLLNNLVQDTGLDSNKIHLIGYSLGAHVVGMMGRTFASLSGNKVDRVTGLDPAGPLFAQNVFSLKKHIISTDSGSFVDIIHTNGGFTDSLAGLFTTGALAPYMTSKTLLGDLRALGHADFYPNGGQRQEVRGCHKDMTIYPSITICSHSRVIDYYIESILEGPTGFPAYPCASPKLCSKGQTTSSIISNHMGQFATKPTEEAMETYYLDVSD